MGCCLEQWGLDRAILPRVPSFSNSCFISSALCHWHQGRLDCARQGEQRETCRHWLHSCVGLLLLSLPGYLQCKTNCIKCNSSLFLRAVIMHSQTTNMGVECDGVNICCYYANYAFCIDFHIIVTNRTHLCCANSRVWVTPFFKLLLYTYICTDLEHTTNE